MMLLQPQLNPNQDLARDAFKARLDVALGSLVWWLVTLHTAGGLKPDGHCGPFQPRPFYDCVCWFKSNGVWPLHPSDSNITSSDGLNLHHGRSGRILGIAPQNSNQHSCPGNGGVTHLGGVPELRRCGTEGCGHGGMGWV